MLKSVLGNSHVGKLMRKEQLTPPWVNGRITDDVILNKALKRKSIFYVTFKRFGTSIQAERAGYLKVRGRRQ